jgi:hypothetical protein
MNLSLFNGIVSAAVVILREICGRVITLGKLETIKKEAVVACLICYPE